MLTQPRTCLLVPMQYIGPHLTVHTWGFDGRSVNTYMDAYDSCLVYTWQVRMYYRSGTNDHCCIGAHTNRRFVFTRQAAALFCVKWRNGRHLETECQIQHSCQTSSQSALQQRSLRLFWSGRPNNKKNNNKKKKSKISSGMRSVPDLKSNAN